MRGKKSRVLSYGICVHCVAQIDLKGVGDMEGRKEEWGVQNGGEWKQRAFHPIRVASGGIEISFLSLLIFAIAQLLACNSDSFVPLSGIVIFKEDGFLPIWRSLPSLCPFTRLFVWKR